MNIPEYVHLLTTATQGGKAAKVYEWYESQMREVVSYKKNVAIKAAVDAFAKTYRPKRKDCYTTATMLTQFSADFSYVGVD